MENVKISENRKKSETTRDENIIKNNTGIVIKNILLKNYKNDIINQQ